jgi:Fe-S cluster assembly protein SufD
MTEKRQPNTATIPAHSHGVVPAASRAERQVSFDLADFPPPTGREEEWRFTPLDRMAPLLEDRSVKNPAVWNLGNLPVGVSMSEISAEEARDRAVRAPGDRASAIAFERVLRHFLISVAPGTIVPSAFEIGVKGVGEDVRGSVHLDMGEGAEMTFVVTDRGRADASDFITVNLGPQSSLNLVFLYEWDPSTRYASEIVTKLDEGARLRSFSVILGGDIVRLSNSVILAGEGAEADLYGLYLAGDGQHIENRTFIDHVAPRCRSRVTYKGALSGETARTVWVGDVLIRAEAEGTDTYELNRNLILSDGARADSVPNLEIETGEILGAGHASATGRFDEEQLFYLRSRGITESEARKLIVRGFFADIVQEIGVLHIERPIMKKIEAKLGVADD